MTTLRGLEQAADLRDRGRFAEALRILSASPSTPSERVRADILKADLLERTGQYAQSRSALDALSRRQLPRSEQGAIEFILGRLNVVQGLEDEAIANLQHSIAIMRETEDVRRLCWAQLRLLLLLADRASHEAVTPLLNELRVQILRAGDPTLMAALHIHIAELEARRGLISSAQRHVRVGCRGLSASSNIWLEALAANVQTAISTMTANFRDAIVHSRHCVDLAEEAGAAYLRDCAVCNLGNLMFVTGRFDEARIQLQSGRDAFVEGSDDWKGCTETLARLSLAEGNFADCRALLDGIDVHCTEKDHLHYAYRHTQLTRIRLSLRLGLLDDAARQIGDVLALADQAGDDLLNSRARLLEAQVLLHRDRTSAPTIVRQLARVLPQDDLDARAQFDQMVACTLIRDGRPSAWSHLRRAQRVFDAVGNRVAQIELERDWHQAVDSDGGRASVLGCVSSASIVGDIAAMFMHRDFPELVAREIVGLLSSTDAAEGVAAIARSADGTEETLARFGPEPSPTDTADQWEQLPVGAARGREIHVAIRPKPDLEATATVNAVGVLLAAVRELERARGEREERATLWPVDELPSEDGRAITIGHMREMMGLAKRVAGTNVSVLITGESGTGKEVIARAVHAHSPRADKPFVPFNCTAVPRDMLEGQLFGHRRGAFTGADRDNPGVIRSARDGTIFLDEIGELGLDLQPKLLRFLESGEICPLGESMPLTVNVRIIAATNMNLDAAVREGRFREDLFYRLNVIRLSLKPLRERRDEIPTLVNHFLMLATEELHKTHLRLAEETIERLVLYSWPGNVRQLQNEIRRIVALAESNTVLVPTALSAAILRETDLAAPARRAATQRREVAVPLTDKLQPTLARVEREMIALALRDHHGQLEAAARALGISRKGLYLKRQRLGL